MRRIVLPWVIAFFALALAPRQAAARPPSIAEWTRIDVPPGPNAGRLARQLKVLLDKAARRADFGRTHPKLAARLVELRTEERDDVVRLSCVLVGRLEGGKGARSRISFGGRPSERAALERQVLTMVANGIVTRLAALSRARAAR